jgi:hypothetical protein
VAQALDGDASIGKIDLQRDFTMEHFLQFVELWTQISNIQIHLDMDVDISWKLMPNGQYSTKSAYEMQFFGSIISSMDKTIWKAWAPTKVSFLCGFLVKTEFGRPTAWRSVSGRIPDYRGQPT